MFGKLFASMYRGSMYGAGPEVFAVWPYVIATADMDGVVELNSEMMANALGMTKERVEAVIERFLQPDPKSRSKVKDGRKLERLGEYSYQIINYAHYRAIRTAEERREQNRVAAADYRVRQKLRTWKAPMQKKLGERVENG